MSTWTEFLPREYQNSVISPKTFVHHTEPSVSADKIIGYDAAGTPCFYFHSFLLMEEGFDVDEFPILINAYYECVVAWRHWQGQWIKLKSYSDKLEGCNKKMTNLPPEVIDSMPR